MKSKINIQARDEKGSALMCALGVLTVLSLVAASLLLNCTTRYNVTSKQVKGWKEALIAAEAGADLAFAEVRKNGLDSTKGFAGTSNWVSPAPSPLPSTNSWELGYTKAGPVFGDNNSLHAKVTVDKFQALEGKPVSDPTAVCYYRIRSIGTADLGGFARAGMDDRMNATTRGDSLIRKIDFITDHFLSTYGFGDALSTAAATSGNGKTTSAVSKPQISRRIELIAIPVTTIEAAIKTNGGSYSFPLVDSFDSQYGAYPGSSLPSTAPYNTVSNQGNVIDGSSAFSGQVYGSVTTNGGSASSSTVTGVIDNNVPVAPISNMAIPSHGAYESQTSGDITAPAVTVASRDASKPTDYRQQRVFWYHYSSISGITVNPAPALYSANLPTGALIETTVNIVCDGDVNGVTVTKGAKVNIYFGGNIGGKARDYDNQNTDGDQVIGVTANPVVIPRPFSASTTNASTTVTSATANFSAADVGNSIAGIGIPSGATISAVTNATTITLSVNANATSTTNLLETGYIASTDVSRANHLWFYGEGASQTIDMAPASPTTVYACWYAPNADFTTRGNPQFVGAAVVKSFYGNGGNTFHYDLELANGNPLDYRVASYIEDVR
jgi:hypothetical protein